MNLMVWELINYPKSQQWLDSNTSFKINLSTSYNNVLHTESMLFYFYISIRFYGAITSWASRSILAGKGLEIFRWNWSCDWLDFCNAISFAFQPINCAALDSSIASLEIRIKSDNQHNSHPFNRHNALAPEIDQKNQRLALNGGQYHGFLYKSVTIP